MIRCICEFDACCGGSGVLQCMGCGGDQCVCRACFSNGETECDGCEMCGWGGDDSPEDDRYDSDYEDQP